MGPTNTTAVSGIEAQHLAVQTGQGMFLLHSLLLWTMLRRNQAGQWVSRYPLLLPFIHEKKLETDRKPTLVMQKSLNISHRSISKFQTFGPFASVNHAIPSPIFRLAWPGRRVPGRGRPRPPGPRRIGAPGIQIDCYMGVSKNRGIPKSSTCFWGFSMK